MQFGEASDVCNIKRVELDALKRAPHSVRWAKRREHDR